MPGRTPGATHPPGRSPADTTGVLTLKGPIWACFILTSTQGPLASPKDTCLPTVTGASRVGSSRHPLQ